MSWSDFIKEQENQEYFQQLFAFLKEDVNSYDIFPSPNLVFSAFKATPLDKIRVVILGQDCYHGEGQAHGLAFSVPPGISPPPSLRNIFKEISADTGIASFSSGCLLHWAKQGVFLLNSLLTVRKNLPGSHKGKGWEMFTDRAISLISSEDRPMVFLLWGNYAREKRSLIDDKKHLVLTAAHPSPLSAYHGFFGCRHFSKVNAFLEERGEAPIDWSIP